MDRSRPRLCENTQELTRRRIVFSIALFPTAATALFIFKLTKSRSIFYVKIEGLCFHTAWPLSGWFTSKAILKGVGTPTRPRVARTRRGLHSSLHVKHGVMCWCTIMLEIKRMTANLLAVI